MVETLKQTVCKGATDAQFRMFSEVCKATGLNPFLKEIWYVPNVGVMAARDGYLRVANSHPQFDGMETRVERDEKNIPIKAICSVWRKDRGHPITCEAFYSEYKKNSSVWQTYPSAMISKVAEVLALKRSFAINGVVTEEEIGGDGPPQETPQQVAERQIAANNQKRIEHGKPAIVEANPTYEERHTALVMETAAILDEAPRTAAEYNGEKGAKISTRKKGAISFEALKSFADVKKQLRAAGDKTDTLYYQCLDVAGCKHADELGTQAGREVYKTMLKLLRKLEQNNALRSELEGHLLRIGAERFINALGGCGFSDLEEVLANASGDQLDALQRDLKAIQ
jgi:phage recombination protein Bet